MNKFIKKLRRWWRMQKQIALYISTEREMTEEDRKAHLNVLFEPDFKSIEKGLIVRIGERMDAALNPKTSDMDRKAAIECIEELKDILLEWMNIRIDSKEEEDENS